MFVVYNNAYISVTLYRQKITDIIIIILKILVCITRWSVLYSTTTTTTTTNIPI